MFSLPSNDVQMTTTERLSALKITGWAVALTLISVVLVFLVIRVITDAGNITSGVLPPEGEFERRYAQYPVLAYLHIAPGLIYLLGAPLQLSARIRSRNIGLHRAMGRLIIPAGLVTGVFAIAVGLVMPFGEVAESLASTVFGLYFLVSLVLAYRAIRRGEVSLHRRWMIRAFAIGVGVGLIRIVVGVASAAGIDIESSFGAAFWIAFVLMTLGAEVWLRQRPAPYG